jgi:hypothetical protein
MHFARVRIMFSSLSKQFLRIGLVATIIFGLCNLGAANAQTSPQVGGTSISVGPSVLDTTLARGQNTTRTFNVTNDTNIALKVGTSTHSLVATNTDLPDEYRTKLDASTWITLSPPTFNLNPNEAKVVTATFTAPADAESGGHYA